MVPGLLLEVLLEWRLEVSEGLNQVIRGVGGGENIPRGGNVLESAGELFKYTQSWTWLT